MWAFRKEFDLRKATSVKVRATVAAIPSLPAGCFADKSNDSSNFITASKYVSIPLTNPAEDPLPSQWEERYAPIAEYFVTGTHDGVVSIIDVSGRNRMVRLAVHAHDSGRHENKSSKDLVKSKQRDAEEYDDGDETKYSEKTKSNNDENPLDACEVIALDVSGTIVASIAANDPRIIVSFLYPNAGDRIVEIRGPSAASSPFTSSSSYTNEGAFRSVMLWEGHPRWANQPDEERMLYVFAGTDTGAVLLYRVDVVERRYWLHSKFAVNVSGIDGAAAVTGGVVVGAGASSGERNVSSRRFTNPIHALALHDTNKKRAAYVAANPDIGAGGYHIYEEKKEIAHEEGVREDEESMLADKEDDGDIHLLGGTNNRWACWPLRFVPWGAPRAREEATCSEETQTSPESNGAMTPPPRVDDRHQRLLAARAAGSRSVVRKLSDEQLRGALVFIPFSPAGAKAIYITCARNACNREDNSSRRQCEDDKWRPKYDIVCGGAEIGTIMAVSRQTEEFVSYQVEFPSLKKIVTWPSILFDLVNTQTLFAKADSVGPVFSIAPLGPRRFVTGGADGLVKVWEWCGQGENVRGASADAEREGAVGNNPIPFQPVREGVYKLLHRGGEGRGHSDLVKCVAPLRAPDVFISASYDGTMREWHIYDEPSVMLCRNTTQAIPNTTSASREEGGMGVATLSLVNGSRGLAVTGLFDLKVRTFAFMPVLGCELPDNMVFDGEKTRRIELESAPKSRNDAAQHILEPRDPHTEAISRYVSEIK